MNFTIKPDSTYDEIDKFFKDNSLECEPFIVHEHRKKWADDFRVLFKFDAIKVTDHGDELRKPYWLTMDEIVDDDYYNLAHYCISNVSKIGWVINEWDQKLATYAYQNHRDQVGVMRNKLIYTSINDAIFMNDFYAVGKFASYGEPITSNMLAAIKQNFGSRAQDLLLDISMGEDAQRILSTLDEYDQ